MEEMCCAQNGQNLNWFPGITPSDYVSSNIVQINIPFSYFQRHKSLILISHFFKVLF